jgi:hypothetical protein
MERKIGTLFKINAFPEVLCRVGRIMDIARLSECKEYRKAMP